MRPLMLTVMARAVAGFLLVVQAKGVAAQELREATLAVTGMT